MALRNAISTLGSTALRKLRILPQVPGRHTGTPDTSNLTYSSLIAGNFTGPSSANVASPANSIMMKDCTLLGVTVTPVTNSGNTITAGSTALVTFDSGTAAAFPLKPFDFVFLSTMANWAPTSTETLTYADPLNALGLVVVGVSVLGAASSTACHIAVAVLNTSGSSQTVPGTWLPQINILRIG